MNCKKTWTSKRLLEVIDFNPKETLRKGQRAKKIAMEQLRPFSKTPMGYCEEFYNGGAKFKNGDTLLARITPCLENGKTAQDNELEEGEVGFGSTEYIVLRAKEGKSDKDFIYYLSISPNFRSIAIKSMVGSSGRQRVQQNVLENAEFLLPDLKTQKRISAVLGSLDNKIELNEKINQNLDWEDYFSICRKIIKLEKENQNLEAQAQAIFKSWFVDFEPFGGKMPKDWAKINLSDIADFVGGYSYKSNELQHSSDAMATIKNFDRNGGFKLDGFKEIIPSSKLKDIQKVDLFDTLVAHTDLTQNADVIGNAEMLLSKARYSNIIISMDVVKVIPKNGLSKFLLAALLKDARFKKHCLCYVNGTTVLHLSKKALPEYIFAFPNNVENVCDITNLLEGIYRKMARNIEENTRLSELRDTLLPKLMSGEIDVSDVAV